MSKYIDSVSTDENVFTNDFSKQIWEVTYKLPGETCIEDTWKRVAKAVASVEPCELYDIYVDKFYDILENFKFIPGGRILANAGSGLKGASLTNCFVSPLPSYDVDSIDGITEVLRKQMLTLKSEGGWGLNFSFIRPRGSFIKGIGARTPGAIKYMEIFDKTSEVITEGPGDYQIEFEESKGKTEKKKIRKGAMMSILDIWHPDIYEFITAKQKPFHLTKMNMSVNVSNEFMDRLIKVKSLIDSNAPQSEIDEANVWQLRFPDTEFVGYKKEWDGNLKKWESKGYPVKVYKTTKVTDLWETLMQSTSNRSEPGVLFLDRANETHCANYIDELYLRASNPCLTGDTKVALADGRTNVTIKELAEAGKDVHVLACNDSGEIVTKLMRHPRLTGHNKDVYRVTLDDGNHIDCTANHKFRLSDGTYKEVKDMSPGDSLYVASVSYYKFNEIFNKSSNSQLYAWVNSSGKKSRKALHRINAEFKKGGPLSKAEVVHHIDLNGLNNSLDNLEIMSKSEHDALHCTRMFGDSNPMRRAHSEWTEEKWNSYREKQRIAAFGENNKNYKGVSNELLLNIAKDLILRYKRFFSIKELQEELKHRGLHVLKSFNDDYRVQFFGHGGIRAICKLAAESLGVYDTVMQYDSRLQRTYLDAVSQGYKVKVENNRVLVLKHCEECGREFYIPFHEREGAFCSVRCSNRNKAKNPEVLHKFSTGSSRFAATQKVENRLKQLRAYTDLKFELSREPFKSEFDAYCRKNKISRRFGPISAFRSYAELKSHAVDFNHRVVSVEYLGKQDVYTGTVDDVHNYCVGMFETVNDKGHPKFYMLNNKQCGEQILYGGGSCNLGSINLTAFVKYNPELKIAEFDFKEFTYIIPVCVRFLDNVLDIANLPLEEYEYMARTYRRIGLGLTGIGSALMMLGYKYDSQEAKDFLSKVLDRYNLTAIAFSMLLAQEKGAFLHCDPAKHAERMKYTFRSLPKDSLDPLLKDLSVVGVRNSALFSIQPTGNTGCLANNISGGVEPVFQLEYYRIVGMPNIPDFLRDKCPRFWEGDFKPNAYFKEAKYADFTYLTYTGEDGVEYQIHKDRGLCKKVLIRDYAYQWIKDHNLNYPDEVFTTAMQLPVESHLDILKLVSSHLDSAVSKTINVGKDYPYEKFKNVYLDAYKSGVIKGVTTYREGSMSAVLQSTDSKEDVNPTSTSIIHPTITADKRPDVLPCRVFFRTVKGVSYYFIVSFLGDCPFEMFIDINEDNIFDEEGEWVERRRIIPKHVKEGTLRKIAKATFEFASKDGKFHYKIVKTNESSDKATLTALARLVALNLQSGVSLKEIIHQLSKTEGDFTSIVKAINKVLLQCAGKLDLGETCPVCGGKVLREEGCKKCYSCGWSACG